MGTRALAAVTSFEVCEPRVRVSQRDSLTWMAAAHARAEAASRGTSRVDPALQFQMERVFAHYGVNGSLIRQRYFDSLDVARDTGEGPVALYLDTAADNAQAPPCGKDISERTRI